MKEHNGNLRMELNIEREFTVKFVTDLYNYYLDKSDQLDEFDQGLNFTQFEVEISEVCMNETDPISHISLLADPVPDVCGKEL